MNENQKESIASAFLLFLAFSVPVLSFMLWTQALAFDPCNNIFSRHPRECVQPGTEAIIVGAATIAFGLMIAWGGVRSVFNGKLDKHQSILLAWFGLWTAICGGAYAYVGIWEA